MEYLNDIAKDLISAAEKEDWVSLVNSGFLIIGVYEHLADKTFKKTLKYPYKKFTEILINLSERQEYYKIFTTQVLRHIESSIRTVENKISELANSSTLTTGDLSEKLKEHIDTCTTAVKRIQVSNSCYLISTNEYRPVLN